MGTVASAAAVRGVEQMGQVWDERFAENADAAGVLLGEIDGLAVVALHRVERLVHGRAAVRAGHWCFRRMGRRWRGVGRAGRSGCRRLEGCASRVVAVATGTSGGGQVVRHGLSEDGSHAEAHAHAGCSAGVGGGEREGLGGGELRVTAEVADDVHADALVERLLQTRRGGRCSRR